MEIFNYLSRHQKFFVANGAAATGKKHLRLSICWLFMLDDILVKSLMFALYVFFQQYPFVINI